ncbi:MAG: hypothetical protein R3D25_23070 [Geminicoccaceae bacterium]
MTLAAAPPITADDDAATPLGRELAALIAAHGPIDVGTFMALALGHPTHGYYPSRATLGPDGDFVTAPEASQLFGELVGAALAATWLQAGGPPARGRGPARQRHAARRSLAGFPRGARRASGETSPLLRQ